jgi:tetratricopeptide (TPR) repeat protein
MVRLTLAEALRAAGDTPQALTHVVRAVRDARSALGDRPTNLATLANRAAATSAVQLLGTRSPRLLAVLGEQNRQLALDAGPDGQLEAILVRARVLARGGDRARAAACFQEARRLASDRLPARAWEVDADEAQYAIALGEPLHGGELNLALLDRPGASVDVWTRARCLTNAVFDFLGGGAYARAFEHVEPAQRLWQEMEHEHAIGNMFALRGELLRRTGDLAGAGAALRSSDTGPARGFEGDRHEYLARLALDEGRFDEAQAHAGRAMDRALAADDFVSALERGLVAEAALVAARRMGEAIAMANRVTALAQRLYDFSAWQTGSESEQADEHAGRAVRILVTGIGELSARVRSAVEHLEVAIVIDPSVMWYRLEVAFAEMAAGRQRQAAKHVADAIDLTDDEPLRKAIEALGVT